MTTETLTFNFDAITPRMMMDFRSETGTSIMDLATEEGVVDMSSVSPEVMAGIVWLALRMSGRPDATWDEALDTPFASLEFDEDEVASDLDPTPAD